MKSMQFEVICVKDGSFHQAENIIMERFTYIIMYGNFVVTTI